MTRISGSMDPNMNPRVADPKMNPRTEAEQDLISFLSPNPSKTKSAINAFVSIGFFLRGKGVYKRGGNFFFLIMICFLAYCCLC